MADLPEEIIEEILIRLPVKSLLRFRTASKKWYSLISQDEEFAKIHPNHQSSSSSSSNKNPIFFQTEANAIFQFTDIINTSSSKIYIPDEMVYPSCDILNSANGLILLITLYDNNFFDKYCFIWNPCTGNCTKIRMPTDIVVLGLGYDAVSDDYKIVGKNDSEYHVYSLKSNSLRMITELFSCPTGDDAPVNSNGAMNWILFRKTIAALDWAKEEFFFMEIPEKINAEYELFGAPLFDQQGSLCVFASEESPPMTIVWVMKEYGNSESWEKLFTVPAGPETRTPIFVPRAGEVVFGTNAFGYVKYGIHGKIRDVVELKRAEIRVQFTHSESLIWPKYLNVLLPQCKKKKMGTRTILLARNWLFGLAILAVLFAVAIALVCRLLDLCVDHWLSEVVSSPSNWYLVLDEQFVFCNRNLLSTLGFKR